MADAEPSELLSNASRLELVSIGDASVANAELAGSTAKTRLSNRLASKPGSTTARRSIAAMRFSST